MFEIHDTSLTNKLCDWVKRDVIFTITWASWVGKDRILNSILETEEKYIKPVSFTTRKPRPWEIEWVDYYFITEDEFQRLLHEWEIFEHTLLVWWIYWYTNKELERVFATWKIPVCIVDEVWVHEICDNIKWDMNVFKTFILPPKAIELRGRLKWRELEHWIKEHLKKNNKLSRDDLIWIKKDIRKPIKTRFSESKHWIRKAKSEDIYDWFLVNDDLDWAITILKETFEKILDWKLR